MVFTLLPMYLLLCSFGGEFADLEKVSADRCGIIDTIVIDDRAIWSVATDMEGAACMLRADLQKASADLKLHKYCPFGPGPSNGPNPSMTWDIRDGTVIFAFFGDLGSYASGVFGSHILFYSLKDILFPQKAGQGLNEYTLYPRPTHDSSIAPLEKAHSAYQYDGTEYRYVNHQFDGIYFDIRIVNEDRIEFYLALDGDLQQWHYEQQDWRFIRQYPVAVRGPFRIIDEEHALGIVDDRWCVIDLTSDKDDPTIKVVAPVIPDTSITIIQDTTKQEAHRVVGFEYGDKIYDRQGKIVVDRLVQSNEPEQCLRQIADFVIANREKSE